MTMQIPSRLIQALRRLMRLTGQSADSRMTVVLGHPLQSTDWQRFIQQATRAGVEVVKQVRRGADGRPAYAWRLVFSHPSALANALRDYARPSPPPKPPQPVEIRQSQSHPDFDDLLHVALVESSGEMELVYGLPRSGLPWKEVTDGLLASGRAVDIAKVYFTENRGGTLRYVWRILWRPDGAPRVLPVPPPKDVRRSMIVAQPEIGVAADVERRKTEEAIELYRRRSGMVQDAEGRWRVPLDPYGRIAKAVLFDPERACHVPGIDANHTGPVTRAMIENPGLGGMQERLKP